MEKEYFGFVYETTNLINNKKYIGKCIFGRINDWKNYLGSGKYFKRALNKYGKENFKREILFLAIDEEELNDIEEKVIEIVGAVESSEFYNLKKTAIGGDIFTHHPEKEKIRKMRIEQMSGSGNHQFNKPKTQKNIEATKEANSKKIIVDGIIYDSLTTCSIELNIKLTTLSNRLHSPYYYGYHYIDDDGEIIKKELVEKKKYSRVRKKVKISERTFNSMRDAAKELKIGMNTLKNRLDSDDFPEYCYLD